MLYVPASINKRVRISDNQKARQSINACLRQSTSASSTSPRHSHLVCRASLIQIVAPQAWLREWAEVIRIDEIWLAVEPLDMRAGFDTALARVVKVFGAAHPHHAYLFANRRANRVKVLIHDGFGIWLAARRLNQGQFNWPLAGSEPKQHALTHEQLAALVLGLPWQRVGRDGVIRII